jgi:hypothetical protein
MKLTKHDIIFDYRSRLIIYIYYIFVKLLSQLCTYKDDAKYY